MGLLIRLCKGGLLLSIFYFHFHYSYYFCFYLLYLSSLSYLYLRVFCVCRSFSNREFPVFFLSRRRKKTFVEKIISLRAHCACAVHEQFPFTFLSLSRIIFFFLAFKHL